MIQQIDRKDLFSGCILGLAVGDAMGVTAQGLKPGGFEAVKEPKGGGAYELEPGEWTDETAMGMCTAESLLHCKGFDKIDFKDRIGSWYRDGYWSCRDFCFGSGNGARRFILNDDEVLPQDYSGPEMLVCVGPLALYYMHDSERMCLESRALSIALGMSLIGQQCFSVYGSMVISALTGHDKSDFLKLGAKVSRYFEGGFSSRVEAILAGDYRRKPVFRLDSDGDVCDTIESVIWAFDGSSNFKEGALKLMELGGQSESAGALYGILAGAYYGWNGIPDNWIRVLARRQAIESVAERLWRASFSN